jgi:hypothetical protein
MKEKNFEKFLWELTDGKLDFNLEKYIEQSLII